MTSGVVRSLWRTEKSSALNGQSRSRAVEIAVVCDGRGKIGSIEEGIMSIVMSVIGNDDKIVAFNVVLYSNGTMSEDEERVARDICSIPLQPNHTNTPFFSAMCLITTPQVIASLLPGQLRSRVTRYTSFYSTENYVLVPYLLSSCKTAKGIDQEIAFHSRS